MLVVQCNCYPYTSLAMPLVYVYRQLVKEGLICGVHTRPLWAMQRNHQLPRLEQLKEAISDSRYTQIGSSCSLVHETCLSPWESQHMTLLHGTLLMRTYRLWKPDPSVSRDPISLGFFTPPAATFWSTTQTVGTLKHYSLWFREFKNHLA